MCNSAGKVHNCFGIVTGFRFRQQWFNGIWASELRMRHLAVLSTLFAAVHEATYR
jgi:hypothetical protein